ncbi:MAG: ABC transporter ATP-binding protein [Caldilineaceae bacterium]|nr:ABC transporter ATP-binding protein [Caldilineaceae bacterium]
MFLELKNISKFFPSRDGSGEVRAVDDVAIGIEQGLFVTLLGPSGCGKTTTLRLIAGFEFPTHGHIVLDGQEINDLPPNRRDMAMVFQSYAIFPHLNVYENIAYGLKIKKMSQQGIRRTVAEVMDLTELTGLENRAPNQLSGGQQQRVALARALVMEPKVLLFDEPLSNLDAKLRVQMRTEIRRIQKELGITSVYVTHDQDEAMVLSDEIVVMHKGKVQQVGTAVAIYRHPHNRFVADFIGRANFLPVTIQERTNTGWQVQLFDTSMAIASAADTSLGAGQQAILMVRPESIRLTPEKPGAPGAGATHFAGTIARTSYLGSLAEYDVDVNGHRLLAVRHDPGEADLYAEGSAVYVEFLRENAYLLPATE